ncbi:MAG: thiosulfate sulfurtransferase GlpE [Nitrospinaceae bacterium]|nr:thiosulfate sulfurtransferase GlpE [Nitrospinaceae bacterium]NIT80655.1 thiosulfate sulfurtransferase GlpE [Nitrospinaceae bacterium]NIY13679.1 thiosulfate sulfurtransferase GlpE [Nitrospinaceae bacterium]
MSTYQEIDVHRVQEMIEADSANIVDIRDPLSYKNGHLPSAVPLTDETVEEFIQNTEKARPLIVYCYHGISSQSAAAFLAQQGFHEVYSMKGGYEAWTFNYPPE